MNQEYPLKTEYTLKYETSRGFIIFKYEQANLKENFKLNTKTPEQISTYISDFLESCIEYRYYLPKKWYEPNFVYLKRCVRYQQLMNLELDIKKVIDTITSTRFKNYESIFKDIHMISKEKRPNLFSLGIQAICESYNINGPDELFEKYTLEQYQWMMDGLIFKGNEYTPEGKGYNDLATQGHNKVSEEDLQVIRDFKRQYELNQQNNGNR